jgi:uncharacterized protein YjbI with pentapeptide repeats
LSDSEEPFTDLQNMRCERSFRGRSFKGQHLAGFDFSHSDLRGADFTEANLTDANFSHAKAGLTPHWAIALLIVSLLLSAFAGFMSATVGFAAARYFLPRSPAYALTNTSLIAHIGAFLAYVVFWQMALRQGLWNATIAVGGMGSAIAVLYAGVAEPFTNGPNPGTLRIAANGITVGIVAVAAAGAVSIAISGAIAATGLVAGKRAIVAAGIVAVVASIVGAQMSLMAIPRTEALAAAKVAGIASVAIVLLCMYLSWRVLKGDETNIWVRDVAIAIAATGGTRFRQANLTNANFNHAILKNIDLRNANITRTSWLNAKKLDWARVSDTILEQPTVRDLLVRGNGSQKSYVGLNLRGANLIGADLAGANFKEANLSQATLIDANLEGANLTQTQAIGTDFTNAQMTGVRGLGKWNIDSTTELKEVDCRYVYLLEYPKPRTDDCERRPSSWEFAPGEFVSLFQEILDTVDLIFRNGIDWKYFNKSFQKIQIENEGIELDIQSIEKKENGIVVVRIGVPPEANKGKIHGEFVQFYQEVLALDARQQQTIESHEKEIKYMRSVIDRIVSKPSDRLVVLSLGVGDFEKGFVGTTVQIHSDDHCYPRTFNAQLPPQPEIPALYKKWRRRYKNLICCYQAQGRFFRIKPKPNEIRQISIKDADQFKKDLIFLSTELKRYLNFWLSSESFIPINNQLRSQLNTSDRVRFIVRSDDLLIRRIPWHLWDFFEDYRQAEVALSQTTSDRVMQSISTRDRVRILAVLGNSQGINIDEDRQLLANLPNAETEFLAEPTRQKFHEYLWDERGWDILCFSGHSSSKRDGGNGWIDLNEIDKLTIQDLEKALKAAIERGLHLAIFNSCDGLGLARHLENLHIPQIVVMREPVPDLVAQEFLRNFLIAFSGDKPLSISVREARERLQSWENEFPCASWLPVLCANPAEVPQMWGELRSEI